MLGRVAQPFEAVEDQVEPELELGRAVGARRREVLLGVLDDVGVPSAGIWLQEVLGHVDELRLGLERHVHLPEREARDVAVQGVIRVVGHVGREAGFPQRSQDGLHPVHPPGTGVGLRIIRLHAQRWRRNTSWDEIAVRRSSVFQSASPEGTSISSSTRVDDPVEDVVLVRDVVVERHRLDAELLAELAHRQRLDPACVGEREGGAQHALPGQRGSGLGVGSVRVAMT